MQKPIESVNGYVKKYNDSREAGDVEKAIYWGKLAVRDASAELAKPNLNDAYKNHYIEVVTGINKFLADPYAAPAAKVYAETQTEEDDKIKSTDWFAAPVPNLGLKDIAGLKDVKDEFIVNVFAPMYPGYSEIYSKYRGSECGIQALLYGPPGTGKTHIVKCLAGEMGCKIAVVQVKDVMQKFVGDGAKVIAEIFEQANKFDKCIIFFDEIDAIASSREGEDSRHTKEQLTTLLTYMDGFISKTKPGQIRIVIAASNRPWALDSAILRGGRFDTQIYVPLPDKEARRTLIMRALGKDASVKTRVDVPCADDFTIDWLVEKSEGYSGADIKSICRQAVSRPLGREIRSYATDKKAKPDCVCRADFEYVFERYINSITDESLLQFDAYRLNMEYGSEYIRHKCDYIIKELWRKNQVDAYLIRWFSNLCEVGYVWENFKKTYDLSFLEKDYGFTLYKA